MPEPSSFPPPRDDINDKMTTTSSRIILPYGAYLIGPGGEKVGIFYSGIDHVTIYIDNASKTVSLIPDTP
jgi:hypothetical protein